MKMDKKMPAPKMSEQAKGSTIERIRDNMNNYSFPGKVFFDDYKPVKSKSN